MLKRLIVLTLTLTLLVAHAIALPTAKEFVNNFEVRNDICSELTVGYLLFGAMGEDPQLVPDLIAISVSKQFDALTPEQKTDLALCCLYFYGYYNGIMYSNPHTK